MPVAARSPLTGEVSADASCACSDLAKGIGSTFWIAGCGKMPDYLTRRPLVSAAGTSRRAGDGGVCEETASSALKAVRRQSIWS